jgi:hypothetical protein
MLDTPGLDKDFDVPGNIYNYMLDTLNVAPELHGVIYLRDSNTVRASGSIKEGVQAIRQLCGEGGMANLTVATLLYNADSTRVQKAQRDTTNWANQLNAGTSVTYSNPTADSCIGMLQQFAGNNPATVQSRIPPGFPTPSGPWMDPTIPYSMSYSPAMTPLPTTMGSWTDPTIPYPVPYGPTMTPFQVVQAQLRQQQEKQLAEEYLLKQQLQEDQARAQRVRDEEFRKQEEEHQQELQRIREATELQKAEEEAYQQREREKEERKEKWSKRRSTAKSIWRKVSGLERADNVRAYVEQENQNVRAGNTITEGYLPDGRWVVPENRYQMAYAVKRPGDVPMNTRADATLRGFARRF